MDFVCKLYQKEDRHNKPYMIGTARLGMMNLKLMLFKSKKNDDEWNLNAERVEPYQPGEDKENNVSGGNNWADKHESLVAF